MEMLTILRENPAPADSLDVVRIKGIQDTFRIRIGDIRILYQVMWKDSMIRVAVIEFRGRAYK